MNRILRFPVYLSFTFTLVSLLFFPKPVSAQTDTSTTLQVNSACLTEGCVTTLTATVTSGGNPIHPGLVIFCDKGPQNCENEAPIGRAQLTANGTATIRLGLAAGPHALRAIFHGTKSYGGSISTSHSLTEATNATDRATTSFSLNYSSDSGGFDFTSYLNSLGSSPPTGTISFLDTSQNNQSVTSLPIAPGPVTQLFSNANPPNPDTDDLTTTAIGVFTGDFNNDGHQDFIRLSNQGMLSVSLGDGNGNFTQGTAFASNTGATGSLLVGDFNSDGKLDIALWDPASTLVRVMLGNGDGTFAAATSSTLAQSTQTLLLGDFNNDGIPDLASISTRVQAGTYIQILLGNGDGTFTVEPTISFTGDNIASAAIGDFNQDGSQDLAIGYYAEPYGEVTSSTMLAILKGNGDGTFAATPVVSIPAGTDVLAAGDFDGDGIVDIMSGQIFRSQVTFYRGNGDFTFNSKSQQTYYYPESFLLGDYLGNGTLQVLAYFSDYVDTFGGSASNGPVGYGFQVNGFTNYGFPAFADFNGDGLLDIIRVYDTHPPTLLSGTLNTTSTTTSQRTTLSPGFHSIAASYSGDANHNPNISPPFSVYSSGVTYKTGFGTAPNVTLNGAAALSNGTIQLTNGGQFQAGSFFSPNRLDLNGALYNTFDFQFPAGPADGFAYVFQANGPDAIGSPGGGLGYGNPPGAAGPSITNSFALAFDLHNNQGEGSNSIRAEYNGITSPAGAVDLTPSGIDLHSGHRFHVQITVLSPPTYIFTNVTVNIMDTQTRAAFTYGLNLTTPSLLTGDKGYVGFTAATGTSTSAPTIYDWSIDRSLPYPEGSPLTPYFPNGFAGASGLLFNGGSAISGTALALTHGTTFEATSVYAARKISSYNAAINTDFDFGVGDGSGDGFTFVLQDHSPTAVGSSGGGLGYGVDYLGPAPAYAVIPNSLAIKFDLHNNQGEAPNSTGLYINGASPTTPSIDLSSSGINLHSGHTFHARITREAGSNQMTLIITDLNVYKVFQTTFTVADPSIFQEGSVYAGFTAGTGNTPGPPIQILNWTLTN